MRLKMRSNTSEGEDGQQPITSHCCEGRSSNEFFHSCFLYIAIQESEIEWEQENQIVVAIPRQSVLMSPRNLKTLISPSELL